MSKLDLRVAEACCEGCLVGIRLALGKLAGTGAVTGEFKSRTLSIDYEPSLTNPASIRQASNCRL